MTQALERSHTQYLRRACHYICTESGARQPHDRLTVRMVIFYDFIAFHLVQPHDPLAVCTAIFYDFIAVYVVWRAPV
jgi:hypothetical protein